MVLGVLGTIRGSGLIYASKEKTGEQIYSIIALISLKKTPVAYVNDRISRRLLINIDVTLRRIIGRYHYRQVPPYAGTIIGRYHHRQVPS